MEIIKAENASMNGLSFGRVLENDECIETNFNGIAIFEGEDKDIAMFLYNSWDSPDKIGIAFGEMGVFESDDPKIEEITMVDFFSESIEWSLIPGAISIINGRMKSLVEILEHYEIIPENFSVTIYNVTLEFQGNEIIISEIDRGVIAHFKTQNREDKIKLLSIMADRLSELWEDFFPEERDYLFFELKINDGKTNKM